MAFASPIRDVLVCFALFSSREASGFIIMSRKLFLNHMQIPWRNIIITILYIKKKKKRWPHFHRQNISSTYSAPPRTLCYTHSTGLLAAYCAAFKDTFLLKVASDRSIYMQIACKTDFLLEFISLDSFVWAKILFIKLPGWFICLSNFHW